jgi:NADH-quinone oxidoreductase subunit G
VSAKPETAGLPPAADMVTIEVDGKKLQAKKGSMLIQVTDAADIYIPRFCFHKKLSIAANCRMCLVEVEKVPKPVPACATPVMDGMVVRTRSERARDAQKSVMEFLLINHPLDCPICDQGGECRLQDLALGYGKDASRYAEAKRVVKDKDVGPLIETEMTRCIHCTRCVRFIDEIAGTVEMGGTGRGERTLIGTYIEKSIDSEVSGNIVDLCPVGALTSKPFRYKARAWELQSRPGVIPHDCVGTNIIVQTRRGEVLRVLPRENESINECWIADRDRYSYEALNAADRLTAPMIRRGGKWEETDWNTALEFTVAGLSRILNANGGEALGALVAPTATLEEMYLAQKLMRTLGSGNVDHRLRQSDFSDDEVAPRFPCLGLPITELERVDGALLVGSNLRKDQPLLNLRLRKAAVKGAAVMAINPLDYEFNYRLAHRIVADPVGMVKALAGVAVAVSKLKNVKLPVELKALAGDAKAGAADKAMAETLAKCTNAVVLVGGFALSHPQAAVLRALAQFIADACAAKFGLLAQANSAAGWLAGCVPHRGVDGSAAKRGRNTLDMLRHPLKAYVLVGVEPELDCINPGRAVAAMQTAEFVVMLTSFKPSGYRSGAVEYADVWLPLAPFTETAGTFVNGEGRAQAFQGATEPRGQARPGWKILRVLGSMLGLPGFEQMNVEDVRREIALASVPASAHYRAWPEPVATVPAAPVPGQVMRLAEVPIYAVDALTRRAPALQQTADNPPAAAHMNAQQARALNLSGGDTVRVVMQEGEATLGLVLDARVPDGCALVASGYPETAGLGAHGPASVTKVQK